MNQIRQCIAVLFDPTERDAALSMLDELPDDTRQSELRLQFAAIRYSGGSLKRLSRGVELCNKNFRDLLMNAGFGEDTNAHTFWVPRPFREADRENWTNGIEIEDVEFAPDENVWKLTTIQRRKKDAKIVTLEKFEPTVIYLVRYLSGKEELVAQCHLVKREITMR